MSHVVCNMLHIICSQLCSSTESIGFHCACSGKILNFSWIHAAKDSLMFSSCEDQAQVVFATKGSLVTARV